MRLSRSSVERVASVFNGAKLGDPRRSQRLKETVRRLAQHPDATLPQALGSDAALEGAYRLANNERVSFEELNAAHAEVTAKRAREAGKVLAIHDTTTFEFRHADPRELGYLSTGKAGFLAHYTLVVTADGNRRPLGVSHLEPVFRTRAPSKPKAKGWALRKRSGSETCKKDDRESKRWYRGVASTSKALDRCEVIHVADREADNYELLAQACQNGQRFVIRARVLERNVEHDGAVIALKAALKECRGILKREVELSRRLPAATARWSKAHPARNARMAELQFCATTLSLERPRYQSKTLPASFELNVVHVFEPDPPAREPPVEWVLYTTEPIETPTQVAEVIDIYRTRWLIEECNKALKTGCRYEHRQFEGRHALLVLLAMTLPIACELLWLRASARAQPERPARDVLTPVQVEILSVLGPRKLSAHATVRDALWAVAALGGHINHNGEPGWLVLHRGMTKLAAYEEAWTAVSKRGAELVTSR
jgi:transposase-like protein/DDE family transposase